jgi:hypothetical protein
LFDIDAKCRVAAIRACSTVMNSVAFSGGFEWLASIFEQMAILMTDEKTSVRKEALVCLERCLDLFTRFFYLTPMSHDIEDAEMLMELARKFNDLKQRVQSDFESYRN